MMSCELNEAAEHPGEAAVDGAGEASPPTGRSRGSRRARKAVAADSVRGGGAPGRGSELTEIEALKARVQELERHRRQWRNHASLIADLVREKNFDAAVALVAEWDEEMYRAWDKPTTLPSGTDSGEKR
jgi:hypothetical protein